VDAQQTLELPVRMGISTGEAELRGSDYFVAVLNRAARGMAAGHGGQILLDGQTAGLLRGVDLVDLGPRQLRDITRNTMLKLTKPIAHERGELLRPLLMKEMPRTAPDNDLVVGTVRQCLLPLGCLGRQARVDGQRWAFPPPDVGFSYGAPAKAVGTPHGKERLRNDRQWQAL